MEARACPPISLHRNYLTMRCRTLYDCFYLGDHCCDKEDNNNYYSWNCNVCGARCLSSVYFVLDILPVCAVMHYTGTKKRLRDGKVHSGGSPDKRGNFTVAYLKYS